MGPRRPYPRRKTTYFGRWTGGRDGTAFSRLSRNRLVSLPFRPTPRNFRVSTVRQDSAARRAAPPSAPSPGAWVATNNAARISAKATSSAFSATGRRRHGRGRRHERENAVRRRLRLNQPAFAIGDHSRRVGRRREVGVRLKLRHGIPFAPGGAFHGPKCVSAVRTRGRRDRDRSPRWICGLQRSLRPEALRVVS